MNVALSILHSGTLYRPSVEEGILWSTERAGTPGQLTFNVLKDKTLNFAEGDIVTLHVDEAKVFKGFVFIKKRDKDGIIKVTAYDQLRYLKNKDTCVYENKTASEILTMITGDFILDAGVIENTFFKIKSLVEDNTTLFDIIQTALDLTCTNTKNIFVLYDDFGKITLKNIGNMQINLVIDEERGGNFDYTSSIDSNTYNKVKLLYDNDDTKEREAYVAQDSKNMNEWGILQYFETLQAGENGRAKADALLAMYNRKTRNLSIKEVHGDTRVRAGVMVAVKLDLGDMKLQRWMIVENCKHTFRNSEHFMDLTLRGDEFVV